MNKFTCFPVQIYSNFSGYIPVNEINKAWSMHIFLFFFFYLWPSFSAVYTQQCYQTSFHILTNTVINEFKVFATQMGRNAYLLLPSIVFFFLKSP